MRRSGMMERALLAVLMGLFLVILPAVAEDLPDGGVTVEEISKILTDKGYKVELTQTTSGDPKIKTAAEGWNYQIYFYAISPEGRAKSIQFTTGIHLKEGITLSQVNKWNSGYRFARMYKDDEDDPILEMDIDLEHGCTVEAIDNNLERWFSLLTAFEDFLNKK